MRIALIAHDGKKAEMVTFLLENKELLKNAQLVATGTTGKHVERAGLKVNRVLSGPLGGDAQIAAMTAEKKIDIIIFFRDPLDKHPHEPDVQMLMRICDVHNIPLATNPATAELMLSGWPYAKKFEKEAIQKKQVN
ncbi:MAG: methylglyoxal synthase [Candidatus Cyclobacteriaceae bacterium M3_2C_046]